MAQHNLKNIEIIEPRCINITVGTKNTPTCITHTFEDVDSANQFIDEKGLNSQMWDQYGQYEIYTSSSWTGNDYSLIPLTQKKG